ncbi:MAG: endonuclease MutS2, partial [Clostridia bacterium]|nr:endonuclease MutS2 [Clostridia bacterium]
MVTDKVLRSLEFDKVKNKISEYCALKKTREILVGLRPESDFLSAKRRLDMTREGIKLLYDCGVGGVSAYDDLGDILIKAPKGACLSMGELLKVARLLKSGRLLSESAMRSAEENAPILREIINRIFVDEYLEREITTKILSEEAMSDNASERLFSIRKSIKRINEQIREKLASFLKDGSGKYLQENIITMRRDRYVLPVKSEFKNQISGFVHDQSSTGSTVFIEPTAVLELNNSLRTATIEEQDEIDRILSDLSVKVGAISENLRNNEDRLCEIDLVFSKAVYAYKTRSVEPKFNANGIVEVIKGRHPLIDAKKVVPLDLKFGDGYRYLLITGPNTGGKTVTLKMIGLFSVMAASGIFIPAAEGTTLSFFDKIFCDVGDEQSIEQNLSTFSSHIKNIVEITESVDGKSLVLIDEIGAGTDPEEGGAIARAVIEYLIKAGSFGIITTHYSSLKEFAYGQSEIKNACMEFDPETFAPLYKISVGIPGSSNAIEISKTLGLDRELINRAYSLLGEDKISFEKVLREAELSRYKATETERKLSELKIEEEKVLKEIDEEKKRLERERDKFYTKAKAESRRIVNEK